MSSPVIVPSPIERDWEKFRAETFVVRPGSDLIALRAAFEYGFNRGIAYACSQIEWDIQERAVQRTTTPHADQG